MHLRYFVREEEALGQRLLDSGGELEDRGAGEPLLDLLGGEQLCKHNFSDITKRFDLYYKIQIFKKC